MKPKMIIIGVVLMIALSLLLNRHAFLKPNSIPKQEPNLRLETKDSKKDGIIDNWLYRDKNGVPVKWLRDSIHAGRPDKWAFYKDGKAFIDEEDIDHDGKVDVIYLTIWDSQGIKQRVLSFKVQDKRSNLFVLYEDTDWQPNEFKTNTTR